MVLQIVGVSNCANGSGRWALSHSSEDRRCILAAYLGVDYHAADPGIPVSYWRSVGYSQNTFFMESFIDEIAAAGGKDPLELRRRFVAKSPRLLAALNLAADKAEWGKPLPKGTGGA